MQEYCRGTSKYTRARGIPGWAAVGTRMHVQAHHTHLCTRVCAHAPRTHMHILAHAGTWRHMHNVPANQEVGQDIILPDRSHSHSHPVPRCRKGLGETRDFRFI